MKAVGRMRVSQVLISIPTSSDVRKAILSRQMTSLTRPWDRCGEWDEVNVRMRNTCHMEAKNSGLRFSLEPCQCVIMDAELLGRIDTNHPRTLARLAARLQDDMSSPGHIALYRGRNRAYGVNERRTV
jgi:hypothetical protein